MLPGLFGPAGRVAQHRARGARGQKSDTPSARLPGQKTTPCARVLATRVTPQQSPARAACRSVHGGAVGQRGRAPRAEHTERVVHPQNCDDILKFYLTTHKFKREEGRTTPQGTPNLPTAEHTHLQYEGPCEQSRGGWQLPSSAARCGSGCHGQRQPHWRGRQGGRQGGHATGEHRGHWGPSILPPCGGNHNCAALSIALPCGR